MSLYNPTRDQARQFFIESWRKHQVRELLSPLEDIAIRIILLHPEYHALLANNDQALSRDWTPESGEANPFLHLSLHLAIEEQLAIDQPAGLRPAYEAVLRQKNDPHAALHDVLECLGETLWQAQRSGGEIDGKTYVECVARRAK